MRRGSKASSPSIWRPDFIGMLGGLILLCAAISLFVAKTNECAAQDIALHPKYTAFPGLDTEDLPMAAREALAAQLNARYCVCGCLMSVASCLNNHMACRTSRRMGLEMDQSARREIQPIHRPH